MLPGQYVTRGDGTRWQIARILSAYVQHRAGAGVTPVEVTRYVLTRTDPFDSATVDQWGHGAARAIGREPAEKLTPAPVTA